ncbi:hypothetical protein E6C67_26735 [Azospirillum sp. TSA2s]|uniref:hypothetical protein n=1 Tax=Azospirillum sp. TSA2s TaxID=709810 RepID=UPI0010A9A9A0|nr:hypothetical protein [Azospirillum sp. TSA2s]QCG97372.1 hypothetical protein E6C67_26735 [Azospirillum sp. TSA2s]
MSNDPSVRAAQAKRILEDDMFKEMLASIESKATEQWRSSEPHQTEKREDAYRMLRAIGDLRAEFQRVVNDGAFARKRDERKT